MILFLALVMGLDDSVLPISHDDSIIPTMYDCTNQIQHHHVITPDHFADPEVNHCIYHIPTNIKLVQSAKHSLSESYIAMIWTPPKF